MNAKIIRGGWTIIPPYEFELPDNPERYEWQFWNGDEWTMKQSGFPAPFSKGHRYTYRYRPLQRKSRLAELAETMGVDKELLRDAFLEVKG